LIQEAIGEILQDSMREIIAIPLSPYRSRFSTNAYMEEVNRVKKNLEEGFEISFLEGWYSHPLFLEAVREKVREGLMQFNPEERKRLHLIFTAHSLPKLAIDNEPYVKEMEESVKGVLEKMGSLPWHIAFQSRGSGQEEWLGPDVESVLETLSKENISQVLIVPIGFVSDHIEILYDIDILYQEKAKLLGMVLKRTPSLNFSERFIEVLATLLEEHMRGSKESRGRGIQ